MNGNILQKMETAAKREGGIERKRQAWYLGKIAELYDLKKAKYLRCFNYLECQREVNILCFHR